MVLFLIHVKKKQVGCSLWMISGLKKSVSLVLHKTLVFSVGTKAVFFLQERLSGYQIV